MEQFETGMMARSKSGHDAGNVYVITKVEETYVYLVDGKAEKEKEEACPVDQRKL